MRGLISGSRLPSCNYNLHLEGSVVRVGPNELHFSQPQAYHDIYNNKNRWDKEWRLYKSFNEDRSSFGFITYKEAKERRDVLNRSFSTKGVEQAQNLLVDKVKALCAAFERQNAAGKSSDLFWAYRCMTMDIITYLSFGQSVDATNIPDFKAPIIEAMDASNPIFIRFKHSEIYKNMILKCPSNLSRKISPETSGLLDLQELILRNIKNLTENPEHLKDLPHQMTIYHRLMDEEAYRNHTVPCVGSLYEESQTLMFAGGETTGSTLMVGTYYLLKRPETYKKLKKELHEAWPALDQNPPQLRDLEKLPYLNAVIRESLRMMSGVVSGLLRVVPAEGANICGTVVPGGTIVSCGSTFVHFNPEIFSEPYEWHLERWLKEPGLENWLVAFSRGLRMCLGINLAWAELRLTFAHVIRKFDMELAEPIPDGLPYRDCFLPFYYSDHVKATMRPVTT